MIFRLVCELDNRAGVREKPQELNAILYSWIFLEYGLTECKPIFNKSRLKLIKQRNSHACAKHLLSLPTRKKQELKEIVYFRNSSLYVKHVNNAMISCSSLIHKYCYRWVYHIYMCIYTCMYALMYLTINFYVKKYTIIVFNCN